jgi:hypothetical protein
MSQIVEIVISIAFVATSLLWGIIGYMIGVLHTKDRYRLWM